MQSVAAPATPRLPPRRFGIARRAFFRSIEETLRLCGGRRFYRRWYLAPGRFRQRHERVVVPDLPAGLEGLRIAHLSDLHAGSFLGAGDLRHVVAATNAWGPDIVVLTGDLVTHHWEECRGLVEDLHRLQARFGVLAVFGNHDYHGRQEHRIAATLGPAPDLPDGPGVRFLRNAAVRCDTGEGVLAVVGVEDLEEAKVVDLEAARRAVRPGDVEVLLCHNPGGAEELARLAGPGCRLILSGHTHGHQIDLPGIRTLAPPHPGDRRPLGSTVHVTSRGLGVVCAPVRVRSRAEIVLIELTREDVPGLEAAR